MPLSTIMSVMTPSSSAATLAHSANVAPANATISDGTGAPGPSTAPSSQAAAQSALPAGAHSGTTIGVSGSGYGTNSNPVSALIAGRATLVAPPSLSTVNHSDAAHAGSRSRDRLQRLTGRTSQLSVRPDLQQNVSPPTAALPVYTRENISTSQGWSITATATATTFGPQQSSSNKPPPPIPAGSEAAEEFAVHPSFAKDADQRGDVLVRVEGVEFYVHKHILMFSSPFFASLLEGEWKESQLASALADRGSLRSSSSSSSPPSSSPLPLSLHPAVRENALVPVASALNEEIELLADGHDGARREQRHRNNGGGGNSGTANVAEARIDAKQPVRTEASTQGVVRQIGTPLGWSSTQGDAAEPEPRSDENDTGHGSIVFPEYSFLNDGHRQTPRIARSEDGDQDHDHDQEQGRDSDHDHDDRDSGGVMDAHARHSTVRASFYTAEYHFEDASDSSSDEPRDDARAAIAGTAEHGAHDDIEATREERIAHAERALEGKLESRRVSRRMSAQSLASELEQTSKSSRPTARSEPTAGADGAPTMALTAGSVRRGSLEHLTGGGTPEPRDNASETAYAVRLSRRRSASLDSSRKSAMHPSKHRPKARSIALQRKISRHLGCGAGGSGSADDLGSTAIPTRKSSKSFDLSAMPKALTPASSSSPSAAPAAASPKGAQSGSEPVSPLARFESLATPPSSPLPRASMSRDCGNALRSESGIDSTMQQQQQQRRRSSNPIGVLPAPAPSSSPPKSPLRRMAKGRRRDVEGHQSTRASDASKLAPPRRSINAGGGVARLVAVVDLEEETAATFQSFLFHVYPHLDLHVTWFNCGPLLRFADKFQVPYMRRCCVAFLKTALPGRPIEAMRIAEEHGLPEQYKEASRHVLDNYSEWYPEELESLSSETLLKLERKRTWFLERMLKLGLCSPARDYECHANCPDPHSCARLLQEKWQTAYANTFRFSPPQPSAIFRHLRELDGAPFLAMSACQSTARAWVRLLFDRMFSLDTLHAPRQFLFVRLDTVPPPQSFRAGASSGTGGGGGVVKDF
ncbi:uncharacterized protein PFL1_03325 [Pseudozyma flocculosa PF-1]|uniref:BTB domain-containing protein n=2 Tax=Pseudozyma flocculosa TaxID=84751 RepID=A0A5C3F9H5_9BASI|nr:uncharacterized protein PFL1_03325 [Pseudozyma flocculosa PF-1]EPQ29035.1 hypothetical protein PFL1_03325 [Pseudozyma flocculosa PF-1]SPO40029.1 uncharacterized protein PSFLO_05511 [Pseudozyma flocculosa]